MLHSFGQLILSLVVLGHSLSAPLPMGGGAPLNDHCSSVLPQPLAIGESMVVYGDAFGATFEGDHVEGSSLYGYGVAVVWHAFTTTACADVWIDHCGSQTHVGTAFWEILSRSCPANEDIVWADAFDFEECAENDPRMVFLALPAGTYYYPVASLPGETDGPYQLRFTALACADHQEPPVNDHCGSLAPEFLGLNGQVNITGNWEGATAVGDVVAGVPYADSALVWHALVLESCADLTVSYCASGGRRPFGALARHCPADEWLWPVEEACSGDGAVFTFSSLSPGTYYLPVLAEDRTAGQGAYAVEVSAAPCTALPPPLNDHCQTIAPLNLLPGSVFDLGGDGAHATATGDFPEGSPYHGQVTTWHPFTVSDCVDLIVTFCGSAPIHSGAPGILATSCPANNSLISGVPGVPCQDGNAEWHYPALGSGTYYLPVVHSVTNAGPYLLTLTAAACPSPYAPDDLCAEVEVQTLVPGTALLFAGDNAFATAVGDFVEGSPFADMPMNWHAFAVEECTDLRVSYCGQAVPWLSTLGLLATSCPADVVLQFDAVDTQVCSDGNITYHFHALAPGTYYLPVLREDDAGASGPYTITVEGSTCGAQAPSNDACGALPLVALEVGEVMVFEGDNTHATANDDFAIGSPFAGASAVWHGFTLQECAHVTIAYCEVPGWNTMLGMLSTTCPADVLVPASGVVAAACDPGAVGFRFEALAPGAYHVPVLRDAASGSVGAYRLEVMVEACTPPEPTNVECGALPPAPLAVGGEVIFLGENTVAEWDSVLQRNVVWESFSLAGCADVTLAYCGTDPVYAQVLGVLYTSCPPADPVVAASVNATPCAAGDANTTLFFPGLPPGTYHVPVELVAGMAEGPYRISAQANPCTVAPTNDHCTQATEVPVQAPAVCAAITWGDLVLATVGDGQAACAQAGAEHVDVWYLFNSSTYDLVEVLVTGGDGAIGVEVLDACSGTSLACSMEGTVEELDVTIGVDHFVRVFAQADAATAFGICVRGVVPSGVEGTGAEGGRLFPNPAQGRFTWIPAVAEHNALIQLLDAHGRVLHTEQRSWGADEPVGVQPAMALAPGAYLFRVTGVNGTRVYRLLMR